MTNGGTISEDDAHADMTYGSLYGVLPDATRPGYTLEGWYTDPTGGTQIQATDEYLLTTIKHCMHTGDPMVVQPTQFTT